MASPLDSSLQSRSPSALRCSICGADNFCAMEIERQSGRSQPPCWCMSTDFHHEALDRVPQELQGKVCICPSCAAGGAPVKE